MPIGLMDQLDEVLREGERLPLTRYQERQIKADFERVMAILARVPRSQK